MLGKIKNWILKNKGLAIILLLSLVLLVILIIIFVTLLVGGSANKYGNRLEGIEKVKIDEDTYDGIEEELLDTDKVESSSVRLQGRNIYTTIVLKSDTSLDDAKALAMNTLDNYKEEELSYYDFSFFLKWPGEEDIVITGNKHHDLTEISWINS